MRVIETTAHVGSHGMLRSELPLEQYNQDVRLAVVVEAIVPLSNVVENPNDRWALVRDRMTASGFHIPPAGLENAGAVAPLELPGISASEMLVSERR